MKGSVIVHKLYEKCSESRRLGKAKAGFDSRSYLLQLYKYKNVIKNNITSSVIHIIVCLPKTE